MPEIDSIKSAYDLHPTASSVEIARILTRAGVKTYPAQIYRWHKDPNNVAWLMARQDAHRAVVSAEVDRRLATQAADFKEALLDEFTTAEIARRRLVQDALDWLEDAPEERRWAYRVDKDGNQIGEPMIPADIRLGLDLVRDRGRDDGNIRTAERIARLRMELENVEPDNRPAAGATVKLIKPGWEPRRVIDTEAHEAKKAE